MKLDIITGTRPNLVKAAPLIKSLEDDDQIRYRYIHTGQHYDENMYEEFRTSLGLPKPEIAFNLTSKIAGTQFAEMVANYSQVIENSRPDICLVIGDVNSTLACALAARLHDVQVAHLESGLRSLDWSMPEEVNRVFVDKLSSFLFTPSSEATENLIAEGFNQEKVFFVGNIVIENLMNNLDKIMIKKRCNAFGFRANEYILATFHRKSNLDEKQRLSSIVGNLKILSESLPIIIPAHPRLIKKLAEFDFDSKFLGENILIVEAQNYIDFMSLVNESKFVITDSGGVQEETSFLGITCLTYRENTERWSTIFGGTNTLVNSENFLNQCTSAMKSKRSDIAQFEKWDSQVSRRIIDVLKKVG